MLIVDAHCDTIIRIMETGEGLYRNSAHIDIERMKKNGECVQFFAAFVNPRYRYGMSLHRAVSIIDRLYSEAEKNSDILKICGSAAEIEDALSANKIAGLISLEGGDALQGDISVLRTLYRLGVRSVGLTWNHRNEIADGIDFAESGGGLTPFGKKVIREMNRLGMIVDVSHISEEGFYDALAESIKPVIASHSNAKSLCRHKRNLTNEQINAIERVNGVIGICFNRNFLVDDGKDAFVKDIAAHIEYICSLIGDTHVGIGTDFDGVDNAPADIKGVQDMHKVFDELAKLNYSQEQIDRIAGGNFMRVIKDIMQ